MNYFEELQQALSRLDPSPLLAFVEACQGTLWLAGNGGSASTAQHWACDLSKKAGRRVQALGANSAVLTAWANDDGYVDVFQAELHRLARPNDALICLSCSGLSQNILFVMSDALEMSMPVAIVTGRSAPHRHAASILEITVAHNHYGIIEDCHLAIGHWLTEALCSR